MNKNWPRFLIKVRWLKKDYLFYAFLQIISTATLAYENKILVKVDNEIITSIDVLNESKYIKRWIKVYKTLVMKIFGEYL